MALYWRNALSITIICFRRRNLWYYLFLSLNVHYCLDYVLLVDFRVFLLFFELSEISIPLLLQQLISLIHLLIYNLIFLFDAIIPTFYALPFLLIHFCFLLFKWTFVLLYFILWLKTTLCQNGVSHVIRIRLDDLTVFYGV